MGGEVLRPHIRFGLDYPPDTAYSARIMNEMHPDEIACHGECVLAGIKATGEFALHSP
jgi:hypothetical protein